MKGYRETGEVEGKFLDAEDKRDRHEGRWKESDCEEMGENNVMKF